LNVVPYTFVSYRLAREFPAMRESQAIRSINTSTSQLHIRKTTSEDIKNVSIFISKALDMFVDLPIHAQDTLVYIVSTLLASFIAILIARIYTLHPLIVPGIIAGTALIYIAIVLFRHGRERRKIRDMLRDANKEDYQGDITFNEPVRKRIHDIFGQQVDERGHPISDAQATDPLIQQMQKLVYMMIK
jgi:hypothetical protein